MLLKIILTLSDVTVFLSFFKYLSPYILLFVGFVTTNWWTTNEKHNDELKILDEKTIYFISMIKISINELLELQNYYKKTILELESIKYNLPSRTSNSFYMMNKLLQINNVEIYFKIFNKYKGQNDIEQFNEMMKFYDETLTDYKLIFSNLFDEYLKIQNDEDYTIQNYYNELKKEFLLSVQNNPSDTKYVQMFLKSKSKFELPEIVSLVLDIKTALIEDKKYKTNEEFEVMRKCDFIKNVLSKRTKAYTNLFKDLPVIVKGIEEKQFLFKQILERIESNYLNSPKPIYSNDFSQKFNHYLKLNK